MVTVALIFLIVTHLLGVPVMIWAVRGEAGFKGFWSWLPNDEDGGDGGSKVPRVPKPSAPTGGAPLPDSEPSRTRLREHGDRLADPARTPRRHTRPSVPAPRRAPVRPRR